MATSSATLAAYLPKDAELLGQPSSLVRYNGVAGIKFPKEFGSASPPPFVEFAGVLMRTAISGYTGTTGIQVKIHWSAPHQQTAGNVRLGVAFDLKGQTDLPLACVDAAPAFGSANEIQATAAVNATTPGGLNVTSISVPIANIKGANTTNPAIGDLFKVRVRRAVENVLDTLADEIYIHAVELVDY